jgi:hypothetical protein
MRDTIAVIDRRVYHKSTVTSYDEAKATDLYWLLDVHPDTEGLDGAEAEYRSGTGAVSILFKGADRWRTISARILNADKTPGNGDSKATIIYSYSIPAPKVRKGIEVRWHQGHWEKYLKSEKGWIPFPLPVMVPRDTEGRCRGCKGTGASWNGEAPCPVCKGQGTIPELRHVPTEREG